MSDRTATWPPRFSLDAWTTVGDSYALAAKHKKTTACFGTLVFFSAAALWKTHPRFTARGRVRASLQPHIEELQRYGQGRGAKSFYCVLGPEAPGMSSTTHAAFGGWHGVYRYKVDMGSGNVIGDDLEQKLAIPLSLVGLGGWYETRLSVINKLCNIFLRRDFVAVIDLVVTRDLRDAELSLLAARTSELGRNLTRENGICKLVVETSVPKLGDAIAEHEGNSCHKVHVLPMSLEDFKECFAEYVMAEDETARNVLLKQETAPPTASWFGPTDKDREAYTAWASKLLSCKLESAGPGINTVEDLVTEFFYKVGPNVRDLASLAAGRRDATFAESMCCFRVDASTAGHTGVEFQHSLLTQKLARLTAEESQFVEKLLAAGPTGFLPETDDDTYSERSLLDRRMSRTLVQKIYNRVSLPYVGHVYALLMQEHNDDAKVRALMKQYGWVDKIDPDVTASST